MASLHSLPVFGHHGSKDKPAKLKSKSTVRPILKKWSQSEKDKKSVDLDRGWEDQGEQSRVYVDQGAAVSEVVLGGMATGGGSGVGLGGATGSRRFNHSRSISATSHVSIATSNSSNGTPAPRQAGATFVHPFQQTPRTSTPPLLSYANSLASMADARDYSPATITEDDDDDELADSTVLASTQQHGQQLDAAIVHSHSHSHSHNANSSGGLHIHQSARTSHAVINSHPLANSNPPSTSNLRRPSLASQHTSSFSEASNGAATKSQPKAPLRVNTSRAFPNLPAQSSRLVNVSSRSDLYLDRTLDSPASSTPASTAVISPSGSVAPMSPLRTSLDGGFPRLRAKSDLDTATRAEHLRAARRKFEMKERAKEERYAREEVKRRERADKKHAHQLEKQVAAQHKEQLAAQAREQAAELEEALQRGKHNRKISIASSGRHSLTLARPSLNIGRPSTSRKNTASSQVGECEKFSSNGYDNTNASHASAYGPEPSVQGVQFSAPKRKNTAKRKTHSAWTAFVLWFRTKLLRMSGS
ncbi:hypothetical protein GGR57DRAFT_38188 [Xylariaceae sp. FL1272]|nr:hypothetical protein GGR57DRAFT_38188 [Xylariaceae sp. FL1272]